MSWLSMDDAIGMIEFALQHETLSGAVNAVAPAPATNAAFTDALARTLRRPALFQVPAFALNLMFGEMAQGTLLASQRVIPRRLIAAGYPFRHPTLETALRAAVNP
jgi:NAD dependent epimerase/dehydratase family enzyme